MDLEIKKEICNLFSATNRFLIQLRDSELEAKAWKNMQSSRTNGNIRDSHIAKMNAAAGEGKRRREEDRLNANLKLSPKRTRSGRQF